MKPPSPEELAAKVARFNEIVKPGDVIRYHEIRGEGPGRLFKTRGPAEILSGHSAVVWLDGKSGCVHTAHCEVLPDQAAALEEFNSTRAAEFADLMVDEGPPRSTGAIPVKQSKKEKRRAAHLRIAGILWHAYLDGEFGENGTPAADVAAATISNHCRMGGTTFEDLVDTDADETLADS